MNFRIGGLAAALGVGAALAAAGPAWADSGATGQDGRSSAVADRTTAAGPQRPARQAKRTAVARPVSKAITAAGPARLSITGAGQSPFVLAGGTTGAGELSGIAFAGGGITDTGYYAVGDTGTPAIWELYTSLNGNTGRIRSSLVSGSISVPQLGRDSEGIALAPGRGSAWVSDEIASTITEFSLTTGAKVGAVTVPAIFRPANVQNNMGLESLTYGAEKLWTGNEEALRPDGALSTTAAGSWVRLQEFTGPELTAGRQFGYLTDPISRMSPFVSVERSGLVDLVALPNGELLALERELGGWIPRFRSRIYLVGFGGATDVSALPSLADGGFTPVAKTLLWEGFFGFSNFEGIALGPVIGAGTYSLLLVSDDGAGELAQRQGVLSLILRGVGDPAAPQNPPSVLV